MVSAVYWPSDQGEIILLSSRKYPKWPMLLGALSPIIAVWGKPMTSAVHAGVCFVPGASKDARG